VIMTFVSARCSALLYRTITKWHMLTFWIPESASVSGVAMAYHVGGGVDFDETWQAFGVPRQQPHLRSGLATLPSVGAVL